MRGRVSLQFSHARGEHGVLRRAEGLDIAFDIAEAQRRRLQFAQESAELSIVFIVNDLNEIVQPA